MSVEPNPSSRGSDAGSWIDIGSDYADVEEPSCSDSAWQQSGWWGEAPWHRDTGNWHNWEIEAACTTDSPPTSSWQDWSQVVDSQTTHGYQRRQFSLPRQYPSQSGRVSADPPQDGSRRESSRTRASVPWPPSPQIELRAKACPQRPPVQSAPVTLGSWPPTTPARAGPVLRKNTEVRREAMARGDNKAASRHFSNWRQNFLSVLERRREAGSEASHSSLASTFGRFECYNLPQVKCPRGDCTLTQPLIDLKVQERDRRQREVLYVKFVEGAISLRQVNGDARVCETSKLVLGPFDVNDNIWIERLRPGQGSHSQPRRQVAAQLLHRQIGAGTPL